MTDTHALVLPVRNASGDAFVTVVVTDEQDRRVRADVLLFCAVNPAPAPVELLTYLMWQAGYRPEDTRLYNWLRDARVALAAARPTTAVEFVQPEAGAREP